MASNLENFDLEPDEPYPISEVVKKETESFLARAADPKLKFEEWQKLQEEFEGKVKKNPEYRLAYLRMAKHPDLHIQAEIHELEHRLRDRDSKN